MPTDASAGNGGDLSEADETDDLVFAAHDLGRDRQPSREEPQEDLGFVSGRRDAPPTPADGFVIREPSGPPPAAAVDALVVGAQPSPAMARPAAVPLRSFHVLAGGADAVSDAGGALPWTVRDASVADPPSPSRRGWSARQSRLMERTAHDTMRRLREEAVHVSWKAAWIAVTSADSRLYRKRDW
jgi:hypothetical protein